MTDDEIADLPLSRLAELIRAGEISSTRLTEIYLRRIRKHDEGKGINSYITVARDSALRQAEEADRLGKSGKFISPLHGLPFALKDNIETAGMRTTAGSAILSSWVPAEDATVVKKLKQAGAVILGKTNMHEFALGATTNNPHFGPTRNPYDLTRIPGGSSGGSAAAAPGRWGPTRAAP
jgi:aspartyl-tRNA(Asn)/glutamyl-tRNA(Gln) amidotransferase subunit A